MRMLKMWKDCLQILGLVLLPIIVLCSFTYFILPDYRVGDCIKFKNYSKVYKVTGFVLDRYILNDKIKMNFRMADSGSEKVSCGEKVFR